MQDHTGPFRTIQDHTWPFRIVSRFGPMCPSVFQSVNFQFIELLTQLKRTLKVWTYVQAGSTLPRTLVWTKISLNKYSFVYPTRAGKYGGSAPFAARLVSFTQVTFEFPSESTVFGAMPQ